MDAGRLDRRILLKRASGALNSFGEPNGSWTTLGTLWANVAPVSDGERWRAGETLSFRLSRFTIRYSSVVASVDPRDVIEFDGRIYDIQGVKELGRRQFLEITAAARAESP